MDPKFNLKQITVMSSSRMIKRPAYSQEHPNDMCVWQAGQGEFSQQEMGHTRVAQCSAQECGSGFDHRAQASWCFDHNLCQQFYKCD